MPGTWKPTDEQRKDFREHVRTHLYLGDEEEIAKVGPGRLDRSPKKNWVEDVGGLPRYIEDIAVALHTRRGMPISRAIAVAISRCKLWAAGGGGVDPDTRAKAAAAVAEWTAKKARAHMKD